jgi:citronellol/citronellal dehydrogenase
MSDSAYLILTSNSRDNTGNFYIDEDVLKKHGMTDFKKYRLDPSVEDKDLMPDFFL